MSEIFLGNYMIGMERFFNPNTFEYTFNYTLIEYLIDGMKSMDSVSYIAQAKSVLEVLGFHSLSIVSGIKLIPTLSDGKQQHSPFFDRLLSKNEIYILQEQLIAPFYSNCDVQLPQTIKALNNREDINLLVVSLDFPISIYYDTNSKEIKIENKWCEDDCVKSFVIKNIETWKKELSTKEILQLYIEHPITLIEEL